MIHMLKERKGQEVLTKCGVLGKAEVTTTVWWTDLTCPDCQLLCCPPRKRIVQR